MKIQAFIFNPFAEDTYVVWDETSRHAAIIDPGCNSEREKSLLTDFIRNNNLEIKHLLNTHMHIDHSAGNAFIEDRFDIAASCHPADAYLAGHLTQQAQMFGFPYSGKDIDIKNPLSDGQTLNVADSECRVLHIPGHTKGHSAFYFPNHDLVFSGDALFHLSIGRTDFPGGDYSTLIESIENKLLTLPRQTIVLPGHGEKTSIGFEQTSNPYL